MSTHTPAGHRPSRSWMRRHRVLTGLGAALVIFFGSAAVAGIIEGIRHTGGVEAGESASPMPPVDGVIGRSTTAGMAPESSPGRAPESNPVEVSEAAFPAMRGLLSTPAAMDRAYPRLPESACTEQGEEKLPIGVLDSWRIPSGGIACYSSIAVASGPPWNGHIVTLNIYFPEHIGADQARRAVAALLPEDAQAAGPYPGVNNDQSAKPNGSCQVIVYTSPTLANAVHAANPSWTADPSKATANFYSGRTTSENGSEKPFNPDSINEVLVGIGNDVSHDGAPGC